MNRAMIVTDKWFHYRTYVYAAALILSIFIGIELMFLVIDTAWWKAFRDAQPLVSFLMVCGWGAASNYLFFPTVHKICQTITMLSILSKVYPELTTHSERCKQLVIDGLSAKLVDDIPEAAYGVLDSKQIEEIKKAQEDNSAVEANEAAMKHIEDVSPVRVEVDKSLSNIVGKFNGTEIYEQIQIVLSNGEVRTASYNGTDTRGQSLTTLAFNAGVEHGLNPTKPLDALLSAPVTDGYFFSIEENEIVFSNGLKYIID